MVCTAFISEHQKTEVTDKDLKELLDHPLIVSKYIVQEVKWTEKRMFRKDIEHVYYNIYYKLIYHSSWIGDVQCIGLPNGTKYSQVYSYFLGLINGYEEHKKG